MKDILKIIKDYLSIIILIPTLLGALFQIFNIAYYVGLPYIRYFSVSQLIPDVILIIFLLLFLIFIYILVLFFKFQYDEIKFNYFEDDEFYKISTYFLFGILLVMLPFSIFNLYKQPIQEDIINLYSHFFSKVVLTINILLLLLYLNEIINLKIKYLHNTNITIFTRRLIYCLALSSLIYHSFSLTNTLSISNEMIVHSKDLYNFKILKEKLKKNTDILKVEILYLNRDYIFCEITTDHGKEIAIIEQKELLSIFPKTSDNEES